MARRDGKPRVLPQFFTGVGFLFRGFSTWRTAPGLMFLGMVPALIVGAVFVTGFILLGINIETIVTAATPFLNPWDEPYRTGARVVAALALLVVAVIVIVFTFTTVTLIVGAPFYERIWHHVESRFGEVPADTRGFWRTLGSGIGDGLRMLVPTLLVAVPLFAVGIIPVAGQILSPILGAFFGGWFLAVELVGPAFDARGKSLTERRAVLRSLRPMTLGFGLATYLLFLVPLGAVIVMPAAVAGATLLARRELGEETAVSAPARTTS